VFAPCGFWVSSFVLFVLVYLRLTLFYKIYYLSRKKTHVLSYTPAPYSINQFKPIIIKPLHEPSSLSLSHSQKFLQTTSLLFHKLSCTQLRQKQHHSIMEPTQFSLLGHTNSSTNTKPGSNPPKPYPPRCNPRTCRTSITTTSQ